MSVDPKRILVVDDCKVDRLLVTRLLEAEGWAIEEADNGKKALERLEFDPPDLIITDLQMPVLDGLSLVNATKARYPNLPVILITSQGSESTAAEALRSGATSFTPKPFLQKDLVRTVRYVLDLANHVNHPNVTNRAAFQQRFVLENDCHLVVPLIEHLQNFMPSWSDDCRLQIGMAIGEAMVNAMHHGNLQVCSSIKNEDESKYYGTIQQRKIESPFCDRRVSIQAQFDQEQLKIQIGDEGQGFNPDAISDPTSAENLTRLGGRGLLLIRSFMDEVRHNASGNEITLIKRRKA